MFKEYEKCELCPRKCGVDRRKAVGFCCVGAEPLVARAALHMWEEPCVSGKEGSGTVFFAGCTLGCVFCQNAAISRVNENRAGHLTADTAQDAEIPRPTENRSERRPADTAQNAEISRETSIAPKNSTAVGKIISADRLSEIFLELQGKGANNINLVTPTMFYPHVIAAVHAAREKGLNIPILCNTGGYELPETVEKLAGTIDIWMPDFKYLDPKLSLKYSRAADYSVFAKASLKKMVSLVPRAEYDERGMMRRGVIVRHLLLPGCLAESKRVLDYLFAEYGNEIVYSLMSQYTPTAALDREKFPSLSRRVTTYEYDRLIDHALSLGITNAYTQYGKPAKESFIPDFDGTGV